jgi:lipopolysaccharide transport system permease protein
MPTAIELKTDAARQAPKTVILPPRWFCPLHLRELWSYQELLWHLTLRDIKVRYKQTAMGIGWAVIPQIVNMVVFSVLLGSVAKLPSEGVPYSVFACAGLVAWGIFARALAGASASLIGGAGLAAKVYFPRLVLVFSAALVSLVDAACSFLVLLGLLAWFMIVPSVGLWFLPCFILLAILIALAFGVWFAALSVQYRDVAQLISMLIQVWMYVTPVVYSPTLIPSGLFSTIYWMNPMAIVVQGFRWGIFGATAPPLVAGIVSSILVIVVLVTGLFYFKRIEQTFIDVV